MRAITWPSHTNRGHLFFFDSTQTQTHVNLTGSGKTNRQQGRVSCGAGMTGAAAQRPLRCRVKTVMSGQDRAGFAQSLMAQPGLQTGLEAEEIEEARQIVDLAPAGRRGA